MMTHREAVLALRDRGDDAIADVLELWARMWDMLEDDVRVRIALSERRPFISGRHVVARIEQCDPRNLRKAADVK